MKNLQLILLAVLIVTAFGCKKEDDAPNPNLTYYAVKQLAPISTQLPNRVNILFRVFDKDDLGIPDLVSEKFIVKENDKVVGSESQVTIVPTEEVDMEIKTVLLLDNSGSVDTDLPQIKEAAIALVNTMKSYQKMMIFTFSSEAELIQELTGNKSELISAINSIEIGTNSTNLYGSLIRGASQDVWNEHFSIDSIRSANLICMTDGDDTQASVTKEAAILALSGKKVYMLGLGQEMDANIMAELGEFYSATDISALEGIFADIQGNIERNANSYYWLHYDSPKRGDNYHTLRLEIKNNSNTDTNSFIETKFNSASFTD